MMEEPFREIENRRGQRTLSGTEVMSLLTFVRAAFKNRANESEVWCIKTRLQAHWTTSC